MSARTQRQPTDERLMAIASAAEKDGETFLVKSSEGSRTYRVTPFGCTCPHWEHRGTPCKHMKAVSLLCPAPKPYTADAFAGFD